MSNTHSKARTVTHQNHIIEIESDGWVTAVDGDHTSAVIKVRDHGSEHGGVELDIAPDGNEGVDPFCVGDDDARSLYAVLDAAYRGLLRDLS